MIADDNYRRGARPLAARFVIGTGPLRSDITSTLVSRGSLDPPPSSKLNLAKRREIGPKNLQLNLSRVLVHDRTDHASLPNNRNRR